MASNADRFRQLGQRIETGSARAIARVAGMCDQTIVMATPVDTGRARANWIVSIDNPVEQVKDVDPGASSNTQDALAQGRATCAAFNQRNSRIFIQNNLDYIGRLNDGSSKQAPAGFVQKAIQAVRVAIMGSKIL